MLWYGIGPGQGLSESSCAAFHPSSLLPGGGGGSNSSLGGRDESKVQGQGDPQEQLGVTAKILPALLTWLDTPFSGLGCSS